jgi:putative PIN family toxin of toxin-antitoxin system
MKKIKIIIDTNVIVTALLSNKGASFKLMDILEKTDIFEVSISVPLFLEYEYALAKLGFSQKEIEDYLGWLCINSKQEKIHFLWRPFLTDIKDDCVLEIAFNSSSKYIITYNKNDFKNVEQLGIQVLNPKEFLQLIGEIK